MIVTVSSTRGAPGATSWSLLLAAAWPLHAVGVDAGRVMVEADVSGGVVGARYGLGVDPGVVSLIAALRRSDGPVDVEAHGRRVAGGLVVVPGPESGEQARSVWQGTADVVAERLRADDRLWVVDAGRLDAGSPVACFASVSALTLVLCGDSAEDLVQVPARVAALQARRARVGVLVVGQPHHSIGDLGDFFGTGLVWTVRASDELRAITGGVLAGSSKARRSWVWRSALDLAADVANQTSPAADAIVEDERVVL